MVVAIALKSHIVSAYNEPADPNLFPTNRGGKYSYRYCIRLKYIIRSKPFILFIKDNTLIVFVILLNPDFYSRTFQGRCSEGIFSIGSRR